MPQSTGYKRVFTIIKYIQSYYWLGRVYNRSYFYCYHQVTVTYATDTEEKSPQSTIFITLIILFLQKETWIPNKNETKIIFIKLEFSFTFRILISV